jgi:polysaccharide transporter, PST family
MHSLIKLIQKTYTMARPQESKVVIDNAAALSTLQFITYILPIIILPYLFRVIGAEKFGLLAFAQAFVQYFMILMDYGFNVSATKEISLCRDNLSKMSKTYSAVMITKAALICASFILFCGIVFSIPKFKGDWPVYLFTFAGVVGNTIFPTWFFQGTEKMRYITNLNILGGILFAGLIFIFVRSPQDYILVPFTGCCVYILTGIFGQMLVIKRFQISFSLQGYKHIGKHLKSSWDIFISIAAINVYTASRVFAIGLLTNNNITGYYSIAERIANACQTFPLMSFSQAIFPRLSHIFHRNKTKAFQIMGHIQQITTSISLICMPLIFILAPLIVRFVCGNESYEAVLSLRLLLISVFFVHANAFRVQFLLVSGKTQLYSRIHVIMAILGLPLIILLIASFSYTGAAAATIAIEFGIFTITYLAIKNLHFHKSH